MRVRVRPGLAVLPPPAHDELFPYMVIISLYGSDYVTMDPHGNNTGGGHLMLTITDEHQLFSNNLLGTM